MHNLPLILDAEAFKALPPDQDNILLVAVMQQAVFNVQHIPGSVLVEPAELVSGIKPAVGKLPTVEQLSSLFSKIGLSKERHVVVYDDEGGGWAGRFIWTLDVIGHRHYSYLDGGLTAWLKLGFPLANAASIDSQARAVNFSATINTQLLITKEHVLAQISDSNSMIWDARAADEFNGSKITAQRNGHIPGAVNLNWLDLQDMDNDRRLKPMSEIERLLMQQGISKDKHIITHCQTHHRSGLTYLVGKALGYDISAYDGSWSEWGNDANTPIEN